MTSKPKTLHDFCGPYVECTGFQVRSCAYCGCSALSDAAEKECLARDPKKQFFNLMGTREGRKL